MNGMVSALAAHAAQVVPSWQSRIGGFHFTAYLRLMKTAYLQFGANAGRTIAISLTETINPVK